MNAFKLPTIVSGLKDWVIVLGYLLFCVFAALNGVLMLISPARQAKFWDRLVRADRWSRPNPDWKPGGRELERRFAGFAIALMALWMASLPVRWLSHRARSKSGVAAPFPAQGSLFHWFLLVVAVPAFVWGLYMLVKPGRVVRMGATQNPQRIFPEQTNKAGLWPVRLIGVGIMAVSAFAIFAIVAHSA